MPDKLTSGGAASNCGRYVNMKCLVSEGPPVVGCRYQTSHVSHTLLWTRQNTSSKSTGRCPQTQYSSLSLSHLCTWPLQRLYRSKEEADSKMVADIRCLRSNQFTTMTREGLDFLRCIHSWKWCWASGKRMMVVGLGVGLHF